MGEQDARFRNLADDRPEGGRLTALIGAQASELVAQLDASIGRLPGPASRPKPAAALVILDLSGREPRVLMGRRNSNLTFLAGYHVFPGGRMDAADRLAQPTGDLVTSSGVAPRSLRTLAMTAVRETYEETGYLIGERGDAKALPGIWGDFASYGAVPSLNGLRYFARAVTPPGHVRRYDTAFFAVDARQIVGRAVKQPSGDDELTDVSWIAASDLDRLPTLVITKVILAEALTERSTSIPRYSCPRGKWRRDA